MTATVVFMAGGRGLRLHPLTAKLPKPLLQVGEKPILQQIVEGYVSQGFSDFVMCLGYKADLIRAHFGDGASWGVSIRYTVEDEPMGTAGALGTIGPCDGPIIVQNADILTRLDYRELLARHEKSGCDITACVARHMYQVPYGVAATIGNLIETIDEKPIQSWEVLAGIYVLSPAALAMIPAGVASDMPDLLARARSVGVYRLENHWTDVGTFESLEHARSHWAA